MRTQKIFSIRMTFLRYILFPKFKIIIAITTFWEQRLKWQKKIEQNTSMKRLNYFSNNKKCFNEISEKKNRARHQNENVKLSKNKTCKPIILDSSGARKL